MNSLTVYCGSSTSLDSVFHDAAASVGEHIANNSISLVYGGGSIGLMGTVARTASKNGAYVHGVITEKFVELEQANNDCDELIVVTTMQERRSMMIERGDGFLMLPGGIGTYEEFFEVHVGSQIHDHAKPIRILNIEGYFDPLIAMLNHGIERGFMRPALKSLIHVDQTVVGVFDYFLKQDVKQPTPEDILPMHSTRDSR